MSAATGESALAMRSAELVIGGMTCASCAARVEKKLNKVDGVTATVNFATETARVSFPGLGQRGRPDLGRRAGRLHRDPARFPAVRVNRSAKRGCRC